MEPFQIGKNYYVRFTFLKKQYRFSLNVSNFKVADRISEQIERGLDRGIFDSFEPGRDGERILRLLARPGLRAEEAQEELNTSVKHVRFLDAVDRYLENCKTEHVASNYRNEVRVFKDFTGKVKSLYVHQVTADMIEQWRNSRIEFVGKATINRELKMVKRFFNQCVEKGFILKSPAQNIKTYREPERVIRHLSDEEVRKLLEVAPEDLKQVITVLLLTGLRYGELCHLNWSDIDFRRRQVIIQPKPDWNPKNFKKRIIPMHPVVQEILSALPKRVETEYIFPDDEGKIASGGLRNRIYRIFEKVKVAGNVKSLRSTFASNAVMSGMPIYTVSKLLGHHDVKITEKHYAHLAPDYLGAAITMLQPKWDREKNLVTITR